MINWLPDLGVSGYAWILSAAVLSGVVRGFSGFGTAMIYLPLAGTVLSPVTLLITMVVMDGVGPLPNVPRAVRDGKLSEVGWMTLGYILGLPFGLAILFWIDPVTFRWVLSFLILALLVALVSGLRYRGQMTRPLTTGTGVAAGVMSGSVGLAGPPVVLLYVSSTQAVARVRANILLVLLISDILLLVAFGLKGSLTAEAVALGAVLVIPYTLANVLGARIFDPAREDVYRKVAYAIIAGSALLGLPWIF